MVGGTAKDYTPFLNNWDQLHAFSKINRF